MKITDYKAAAAAATDAAGRDEWRNRCLFSRQRWSEGGQAKTTDDGCQRRCTPPRRSVLITSCPAPTCLTYRYRRLAPPPAIAVYIPGGPKKKAATNVSITSYQAYITRH